MFDLDELKAFAFMLLPVVVVAMAALKIILN